MNTIQVIEKKGYTIVRLDRGKANAINFEMVQELREVFHTLSKSDDVKVIARTLVDEVEKISSEIKLD